jgi:outer membrane immunogenic protein
MRKILTGAVLLAAAAATPAFAQEADAPFTGAHIEALGGYDNVEGDDGFAYGAGAGFDFQAGKAILGIEGEYMDSTTRERESGVFAAGDNLRLSPGRDIYVGAKVGFAVAPATMLYGKAGYTNARAKFRYDDGLGTVSTGGNNLDGYRLGVGVEQKFNLLGPSGFVKAEYRYSNYKNLNIGGANVDVDADRHQGVVGVGVRF